MFKYVRKWFLMIGFLALPLMFTPTPTYALDATSITITGGIDNAGDCGVMPNQFHINVTVQDVSGTTDDGLARDVFFIAVFDSAGNHIANWVTSSPQGRFNLTLARTPREKSGYSSWIAWMTACAKAITTTPTNRFLGRPLRN
jgi:hypothetical protein